MAASATAPDVEAVRRFNRFYTRRIGVLRERLLHSQFSLTEGRVLYEIGYHGDTGARRTRAPTARDLVKALDIDAGYLSRVLRRFAARRLITRKTSTVDARQAHLALTSRGEDAVASLQRLARGEVVAMMRPLSPTDRQRVVSAMRVIQQSFDRQEDSAGLDAPAAGPSTGEAVTLREHRAGDMGWVVSRQSALYAEEYGWTTEYEALAARIVAQFLDTFDPAFERCWIAERDAEPVGAVMLVRQSADVAKLRLLHVERTARGLGIGSRLVDACVLFSRAVGYRKITLWTQSNLLAARRLYASAGFARVAEEAHHSFGKDLLAETWELNLSPSCRE
jgi:DNA-binding MarR family transcriptional regulator/GNAT superfamily N-acetyltransferase